MRPTAVGFAAALAVAAVAPADEPLVSDRPTVTASAVTVPRDTLQLETGVTSVDDSRGDEVLSVGEVVARWGVRDAFELRFGIGSWVRVDDGMTDRTGFESSVIGLKLEFADGQQRRILGGSAAVLVETSVPTGSSNVATDAWEPTAVLAAGWNLTGSMSLGVNLGYARLDDDGDPFGSAWVSGSLAAALGDRLGAFVEVSAYNREEPGGPDVEVAQVGITYLVRPPLQLDARIGTRIGSVGPDLLAGAGVVWRIGS